MRRTSGWRRAAGGSVLAGVVRRGVAAVAAFCVVAGAGLSLATPASAIEVELTEKRIERDVLALYDSAAERQVHETRIHQFAEMAMNYLGYRVTYHDIQQPLPQPADLNGYRAVVTWFLESAEAERADALVRWLDAATARGIRHVVLGELAPGATDAELQPMTRLHERLGLGYTGEYVDIAYRAKILLSDPGIVGFERALDKVVPDYPVVRPLSGRVEPHLVLEAETREGPMASAVVATSPGGGFAASNFTIYFEPTSDRVLWVLNPFEFFRRALGPERMPIPDVTTLAGRRIYFSHIDGDGWNNLTEIEPYREQERLSAEVIAESAILPYADLPVSVAVIGGDVDPRLGGTTAGHAVTRLLYAQPQVEVASHTYTHPYNWSFFANYDRAAEEAAIAKAQKPVQSLHQKVIGTLATLSGRQPPRGQFNPYVAGTDDLPRTYLKEPFDLQKEVQGALKLSQSFAPKGKRARLYQWSGDTTPFEGALRATRLAGVRNINGGDSRLDREFPSVAYVPSIGRPAGIERQIYAANSNENTYTNDWTGPYYGFFLLEETLKNTESPRRLKPFNLYYHMYSGEKAAALAAIRHFLDLARSSDVIPIHTSQYAAIADDFFTTEMRQVDVNAWEIGQRGALQTVRFDAAEALSLDPARSRGVLGVNRHNGALYVALDPAMEVAVVALKETARDETEVAGRGLLLVQSRWQLRNRREEDCGVSFDTEGFGRGDMAWRARPGRAFEVTLLRGEKQLSREILRADASGMLNLRLESDAIDPLVLRFACHE